MVRVEILEMQAEMPCVEVFGIKAHWIMHRNEWCVHVKSANYIGMIKANVVVHPRLIEDRLIRVTGRPNWET